MKPSGRLNGVSELSIDSLRLKQSWNFEVPQNVLQQLGNVEHPLCETGSMRGASFWDEDAKVSSVDEVVVCRNACSSRGNQRCQLVWFDGTLFRLLLDRAEDLVEFLVHRQQRAALVQGELSLNEQIALPAVGHSCSTRGTGGEVHLRDGVGAASAGAASASALDVLAVSAGQKSCPFRTRRGC